MIIGMAMMFNMVICNLVNPIRIQPTPITSRIITNITFRMFLKSTNNRRTITQHQDKTVVIEAAYLKVMVVDIN